MSNVTRSIQDAIRPTLTRVEDRRQALKTLSEAVQHLGVGQALALLGPPGVDLRRLATDVIRGIPEHVLLVTLDLAELSTLVPRGTTEELTAPQGAWDQLLERALTAAFVEAFRKEGLNAEPFTGDDASEDPAVGRLLSFANLSRRNRRAPVLLLLSMHRLPWKVSERFQNTLRKALDNGERARQLRLLLTSSSDFLSGDAISPAEDEFVTSPLFFRTTRYTVLPYDAEALWELTPLPSGLPDEVLTTLIQLTSGSIGLLSLFYQAICEDPQLGRALHEALPTAGQQATPHWFWVVASRLEPLAHPARQLLREGLGALMSSSKGRSLSILTALADLLGDRSHEETSAETLLPLELAGLVVAQRELAFYRYRFTSPLVPQLLMTILPEGRNLRERLELFARDFRWEEPESEPLRILPHALDSGIRTTNNGQLISVKVSLEPPKKPDGTADGTEIPSGQTNNPDTAGVSSVTPPGTDSSTAIDKRPGDDKAVVPGDPSSPLRRSPFQIPEVVRTLQQDESPESARLLLELVVAVTQSSMDARAAGNKALLTPAQLELRWFTRTGDPGDTGADPKSPTEKPTAQTLIQQFDHWNVQFRALQTGEYLWQLEAAALFLPPESLPRLLQSRTEGRAYVPKPSDDAFAIGRFVGLLLGREHDPRLVLERLESRLANARDIAVGPLIRLVKACLYPIPANRPTLNHVASELNRVLQDPYKVPRALMRLVTYVSAVAVVALGILDFVFDAQVDNPYSIYTGVKLGAAVAWAGFYILSFVLFGRTEKDQMVKQMLDFLRQRMNRVRWMVFPTMMAIFFSIGFSIRLYWYWGVQLTPKLGHKIEEIKERRPGSETCDSVVRFSNPPTSAKVRLDVRDRDYIFILDEEVTGKGFQRREIIWRADKLLEQRNRKWLETVYLEELPTPSPEESCLPRSAVVPTTGSGTGTGADSPNGTGG